MRFLGFDPEVKVAEGEREILDFMDKALPLLREIIKSPQALGLLAIFLSAFVRSTRKRTFYPTPSQGQGSGVWRVVDWGLDVVVIDLVPFQTEETGEPLPPPPTTPIGGGFQGFLQWFFNLKPKPAIPTDFPIPLPFGLGSREFGEMRLSEALFIVGLALTIGPTVKEFIGGLIPG